MVKALGVVFIFGIGVLAGTQFQSLTLSENHQKPLEPVIIQPEPEIKVVKEIVEPDIVLGKGVKMSRIDGVIYIESTQRVKVVEIIKYKEPKMTENKDRKIANTEPESVLYSPNVAPSAPTAKPKHFKNTIFVLGGWSETDYVARRTQNSNIIMVTPQKGPAFGLQYSRKITDHWSGTAGFLSGTETTSTIFGGIGFSFD